MAKGRLFILSGPSGVGKGTIINHILQRNPLVRLAVSACTRAPRQGERNGVDYHFMSPEQFQESISADCFLEWCEVHGNYYGTLKSEVFPFIEKGYDVLLEIDVQGARKVRAAFPEVFTIFITAPTFRQLAERLEGRKTETPAIMAHRLKTAKQEMAAINEYDVVVVNDKVELAVEDILTIMKIRQPETI